MHGVLVNHVKQDRVLVARHLRDGEDLNRTGNSLDKYNVEYVRVRRTGMRIVCRLGWAKNTNVVGVDVPVKPSSALE